MAETTINAFTTLFADTDNDPPGSDAIAYPAVLHGRTGGTGTYADPITVAVDIRDFPAGTRFYSKNWFAYGIAEDYCAASVQDHNNGVTTKRIDWFAGGKGQSYATMDAYERSLTQTQQIIVNPDPGKLVIVGAFFETGRKASGNTGAVPDTTGGQPPPPPPPSGSTFGYVQYEPPARTGTSPPQGSNTSACKNLSRASVTSPYVYRASFATVKQLRDVSPNLWEVATWAIFDHADDEHFNYVVFKSNESELGQVLPTSDGSNQRYLGFNQNFKTPIGTFVDFEVTRNGQRIIVKARRLGIDADLVPVFDFTNPATEPVLRTSGTYGFYAEDARGIFTDVRSPVVDTFQQAVGTNVTTDGQVIDANFKNDYLGVNPATNAKGKVSVLAASPVAYDPGATGGGVPPVQTFTQVPSFGYSWVSNQGSSIAFPGPAPRHQFAFMASDGGTYDKPGTMAAGPTLQAQGYATGKRVYVDSVVTSDNVKHVVQKYFIVEDTVVENVSGVKLGLWVGGSTANNTRDGISNTQLLAGETKVSGTASVILNPPNNLQVIPGKIAQTVT